MRKPGKLENSNFYIDIYPMIAWIGTFIVLLLIPCLVWLFYTLDWRFRLQRKCTALIECAFDIMTALANQGTTKLLFMVIRTHRHTNTYFSRNECWMSICPISAISTNVLPMLAILTQAESILPANIESILGKIWQYLANVANV